MSVVFRVDSSLQMGSGHLMRCLTLAEEFSRQGVECHFICRELPGNLIPHLQNHGFTVHILPAVAGKVYSENEPQENDPVHQQWLVVDWQTDARQTISVLANLKPDWLVVDHYALDSRWQTVQKGQGLKILVIDDLADRFHECDLLLDQTHGRSAEAYFPLVPQNCTVSVGAEYALLRPEFNELREGCLQIRKNPVLEHILITMGGVDNTNCTLEVLEGLKRCTLPENVRITVVMGSGAPWLSAIRAAASKMPWPTEVRVNVNTMAQLMADSDLCIGAAGTTSWERCCLGLPTLLVILAENQKTIAENLQQIGAVHLIGTENDVAEQLVPAMNRCAGKKALIRMSSAAAGVTDGQGCRKIVREMGFM